VAAPPIRRVEHLHALAKLEQPDEQVDLALAALRAEEPLLEVDGVWMKEL